MLLHLVTSLFLLASSAQAPADTVPGQTDSSARAVISDIAVSGNRVTKKYIILRELDFRQGDTLTGSALRQKIKKARENLLNTSLFNFVSIDTAHAASLRPGPVTAIRVVITVTERWYTWPVPIFEVADRNFNSWWETKDLTRINYGFFLNRDNFRGRKERVALIAQFGYAEQFGFAYSIPYLNRRQTEGINMSFTYTRNHEIPYGSYKNKVLYFKDEDHYTRSEWAARLGYTYRQGIYNTCSIEGRYVSASVDDTIQQVTTDYFENNLSSMEYFLVHLYTRRDCRDSRAYPLHGYFLDADLTKVGLRILADEQVDLWTFTASARKYFRLSDRFFFAAGLRGKVSSKTQQPYYVQRGLGYADYVRGYEYYVVDGQHYALGKAGLKYMIIKPHVKKLDLIPNDRFNTFHYALYAEAFADAGYVKDDLYSETANPLANQYLFGYGAGLDYVTYYDAVLRVEYTFNKMGEHALFIHLSAPI
jgi:outer membrane protein assembly factor BamA